MILMGFVAFESWSEGLIFFATVVTLAALAMLLKAGEMLIRCFTWCLARFVWLRESAPWSTRICQSGLSEFKHRQGTVNWGIHPKENKQCHKCHPQRKQAHWQVRRRERESESELEGLEGLEGLIDISEHWATRILQWQSLCCAWHDSDPFVINALEYAQKRKCEVDLVYVCISMNIIYTLISFI